MSFQISFIENVSAPHKTLISVVLSPITWVPTFDAIFYAL